MSRPRLLDLYCGGGGAARGYQLAGFHVTGIDHKPQPHYAGDVFVRADALEYLAEHGNEYDAIHASPPCQCYSHGTPHKGNHWDSVPPTRQALERSGKLWIIENVPGSPVRPDFRITGDMVGLPLIRRERWFETNWLDRLILMSRIERSGPVITVTGHGTTSGNRATWGRNITVAEMRQAMGIDWMNQDELSQAIPPTYTAIVGGELMRVILAAGVSDGQR